MGKNPVVAVIAVIVLIAAVYFIMRGMGGSTPPPPPGAVFWYDTGKTGNEALYGAASTDIPPKPAASGKEGVRAFVFTEGSCDNKDDRFIGYLEKHPDPEAFRTAAGIQARIAVAEKRLLRRPDEADWVAANSNEGYDILDEFKGLKECMKFVE